MSVSAQNQHKAYSTTQRGEESVRQTEAHALLSCASRLEKACRADCSRADYVDAIQHNQQLWTLFQACLCEKDNPLPRDLKNLLLNISLYVDKASFSAMGGDTPEILKGLISINRNIAAGLSVNNASAGASGTSQPPTPDKPTSVITSA
jgi:flagellar biosynthesis activator protein FlaF